jgi:hypothetical protein
MRSRLLALLIVLGTAIPAGAQDPDTKVTAAQRKQLAAMLDTVRNAERVEALPIRAEGTGLSATFTVVERPVDVDGATGSALGRLLAAHDWTRWSAMACIFDPGVAFRFRRGGEVVVVEVCFMCGEMALDGIEGPLGRKKVLEPGERRVLLRAAQRAFPKQFDVFDEVDGDVKSKGGR